jgi:hypothetical protein
MRANRRSDNWRPTSAKHQPPLHNDTSPSTSIAKERRRSFLSNTHVDKVNTDRLPSKPTLPPRARRFVFPRLRRTDGVARCAMIILGQRAVSNNIETDHCRTRKLRNFCERRSSAHRAVYFHRVFRTFGLDLWSSSSQIKAATRRLAVVYAERTRPESDDLQQTAGDTDVLKKVNHLILITESGVKTQSCHQREDGQN